MTVAAALRTTVERGAKKLRGPLSPKRGNRHYYKGKGGWKGGFVSKHGNFIKDYSKMKFILPPDLTDCELTAYVSNATPQIKTPPPAMPVVPTTNKN
ncbi:54S ribosomal protein L27, mitochondrial [Hondaea fermentalgiana]|uniref:54S ribosomal protein L27, mitochondrial n=1 Tax=Hondaea fermentalgiana TaxID=2315210 RepID=A0A2R5GDE6_9STRA|nr:54S ribosomal protein L27, mitochondrial [Hondaea fermentalgiana]|eukprot:GBG28976.1 54S ribosomal protein L27, mitochondrial [Hondaea fermentalgiana]